MQTTEEPNMFEIGDTVKTETGHVGTVTEIKPSNSGAWLVISHADRAHAAETCKHWESAQSALNLARAAGRWMSA